MPLEIRNTLSAALRRRARGLAHSRSLLLVMGTELVVVARAAFTDASLRPAPWPERRRKRLTHPLLRKSGALFNSIGIMRLTNHSVTVGSPLVYAWVHQRGSRSAKGRGGGIPARPYMPYTTSGALTPAAAQRIRAKLAEKVRALLSS